jgi:hypothetical protein
MVGPPYDGSPTMSLISTLSVISVPALLTNASAVLLVGATSRYGMARAAAGLSIMARGRRATDSLQRCRQNARVRRLSLAMGMLQVAVGSFGVGTLAVVMGVCLGETIWPRIDLLANRLLIGTLVIGGVGMIGGVLVLFTETWQFDFGVPARRHSSSTAAPGHAPLSATVARRTGRTPNRYSTCR